MNLRSPMFSSCLLLCLLVSVLFFASKRSSVLSVTDSPHVTASDEITSREPEVGTASAEEDVETVNETESEGEKLGHFSPEMQRLVDGIHAGRIVRLEVGEVESRYIFRTKRITADNFQISAGANTELPSAFEIFEGREIANDGRLGEKAKLAVVNDNVSMTYTTDAGEFIVEEDASGGLKSRMLLSYEEGSTWGHYSCNEAEGLAGIVDVSGGAAQPPLVEAQIGLEEEAESIPQKEGALA